MTWPRLDFEFNFTEEKRTYKVYSIATELSLNNNFWKTPNKSEPVVATGRTANEEVESDMGSGSNRGKTEGHGKKG